MKTRGKAVLDAPVHISVLLCVCGGAPLYGNILLSDVFQNFYHLLYNISVTSVLCALYDAESYMYLS